jgi:alpha-D-ribose 1-methylphosphonate 5-triphosphate diphosphatase
MDHTPGQRQFSDLEKFADYIIGKHGMSRERFEEYVAYLEGLRARLGAAHEAGAVAAARRYGAVIASHDDTTAEQVAVSKGHGVSIAEFPTTEAAAEACGAGDRRHHGCAEPRPGRLAFRERRGADAGRGRPARHPVVGLRALGAAAGGGEARRHLERPAARHPDRDADPAESVGLSDRGALEVGRRADLLRFRRLPGGVPVPVATWVRGERVG